MIEIRHAGILIQLDPTDLRTATFDGERWSLGRHGERGRERALAGVKVMAEQIAADREPG